MLDLETVSGPTKTALDVVSVAEMKGHLRITGDALNQEIVAAIEEAVDKLDGRDGELNRTILPRQYRRFFNRFPCNSGVIRLPYPPLISVDMVTYDNGDSPMPLVDAGTYHVAEVDMIPQIQLSASGVLWPTWSPYNPRSVAVTYTAGYTEFPKKLRRMVKILATHYFENPDATTNDPRVNVSNRAVQFAMEDLRAALRIPVSYDDWE